MNRAGNIVLNDYVHALTEIQKMEMEHEAKEAEWHSRFEHVLADLKALKTGEKSVDDLVVVDGGYQFMPSEPKEDSNGYGNGTNPTDRIPAHVG